MQERSGNGQTYCFRNITLAKVLQFLNTFKGNNFEGPFDDYVCLAVDRRRCMTRDARNCWSFTQYSAMKNKSALL